MTAPPTRDLEPGSNEASLVGGDERSLDSKPTTRSQRPQGDPDVPTAPGGALGPR